MTATVEVIPVWKKNAPDHERLYELAEMAREHPERFQKWMLIWCEDNDQRFITRYKAGEGTRTSDCLAILEHAKFTLWKDTQR